VRRAGDIVFRYGSWHGDWAPWNMANLAESLLVWDWERFATGVPMGFDAVHHELQKRIQSTGDARDAVEQTVRKAAELLAPFGVPSAGREVMTARLGTIATSVYAIMRVMELVALGKSVDLFTIQRATSRMFRYKTCLLQWRGGRLQRLVTTDDRRSLQWRKRFSEMGDFAPNNPRFAELAAMPPPPAPSAT